MELGNDRRQNEAFETQIETNDANECGRIKANC